jgi:hypothetical protein
MVIAARKAAEVADIFSPGGQQTAHPKTSQGIRDASSKTKYREVGLMNRY